MASVAETVTATSTITSSLAFTINSPVKSLNGLDSSTNSTASSTSSANNQLNSSINNSNLDNETAATNFATLSKSFAALTLKDNIKSNITQRNMFQEVFESKGNELETGALEETDAGNLSEGADKNCKICKSNFVGPRVLSCLHVFCESCLSKMLISEDSSVANGGDRAAAAMKGKIECPECKQKTKIGSKGVESLMHDYLLTNILDITSLESEKLHCTSCKSKEKAISRCSDCATFLCSGCDNAHKYMRCFENHEVVKIEDLQKANAEKTVTIHKPLLCSVHPSENLKYYCFNCEIPCCNDCLIADHKGNEHHYDLIPAAEKSVRDEVENLMTEARLKAKYCDASANKLTSALNELQTQHDAAQTLIQDTYDCFLKVVDRCREEALNNLNRLHSERELKIMDLMQNIENTVARIGGTCHFAKRALAHANASELLYMKKMICAQFLNLISNTPKCDVSFSLKFDAKNERIEQLVQENFGKFVTESSPPSPKESTPPPTLPGLPPNMMSGRSVMNSSHTTHSQHASSVTASSPTSLPPSMQSSFDGDLSVLGNGFMLPNVLTPESPQPGQTNMMHSMQQQNAQVHNGVGSAGNGYAAAVNSLNGMMSNANGGNVMNGMNVQLGLNGLHNLNGGNGMNGAVAAGSLTPVLNGGANNGNGGQQPQAYNSILEYNLSRLASLTESTPDDALVTAAGMNAAQHSAVMPGTGPNPPITLADIISGDQRALNNLQALAKLGMNSDLHTEMLNHQLLLSGPSSGIDCLLPDFCLAPPTSPSLASSIVPDDLNISGFHGPVPNTATANLITGRGNKATPMQIRCKFGSLGTSKGQFNSPHGFCLGVDEEIIVADTNNHRIEVFDKSGTLKFQFGVPGKEEGQLWYPRKVAVMHTNGKFVVCDRGNERSRMQIFSKSGHFMRKIAIRYIDIVAGLAVTSKGHIVAVDSVSPTVFVISEDGELVRWFDCSDYMREPSDIAIRDNDFYVCDFKGHCVAVFQEDGTFQYRIGNEKVTCFPNGIDISNAGDILIGDSHGNRFHVACYSRDGILQSEFECPHVKVSRCCGLKITSEGYVVTLAKNNHHVLVLNTLYVH